MATQWKEARELCIEGKGWHDTERPFDRLPLRAKEQVREVVWNLSRCAAGLTVRFETDASEIRVRWEVEDDCLATPYCPLFACSGLDLYARTDGGPWRWVSVSGDLQQRRGDVLLNQWGAALSPGRREYLLYLPLVNPVRALEIGVPAEATLATVVPRAEKPIICYGTSIVHGMGVSRAGMTYLAMLARRLDYPVLNLGFNGNALMEPEMAELLAELDAAVYIIDALPNMEARLVTERAETFIRRLSAANPGIPIVLVEDRSYPGGWLASDLAASNATRRTAFKQVYARLLLAGVGPLRYLEGDGLLGIDGDGTSDGSHPNDLGAARMADALEPLLRPLIGLFV